MQDLQQTQDCSTTTTTIALLCPSKISQIIKSNRPETFHSLKSIPFVLPLHPPETNPQLRIDFCKSVLFPHHLSFVPFNHHHRYLPLSATETHCRNLEHLAAGRQFSEIAMHPLAFHFTGADLIKLQVLLAALQGAAFRWWSSSLNGTSVRHFCTTIHPPTDSWSQGSSRNGSENVL